MSPRMVGSSHTQTNPRIAVTLTHVTLLTLNTSQLDMSLSLLRVLVVLVLVVSFYKTFMYQELPLAHLVQVRFPVPRQLSPPCRMSGTPLEEVDVLRGLTVAIVVTMDTGMATAAMAAIMEAGVHPADALPWKYRPELDSKMTKSISVMVTIAAGMTII